MFVRLQAAKVSFDTIACALHPQGVLSDNDFPQHRQWFLENEINIAPAQARVNTPAAMKTKIRYTISTVFIKKVF